jgi:hypothetical protein
MCENFNVKNSCKNRPRAQFYNNIHLKESQYNVTQYNDTQLKDSKYNDIQ